MSYWLGVSLAVIAGFCNNFGSVLQKKVVNEIPPEAKEQRFFKTLVRRSFRICIVRFLSEWTGLESKGHRLIPNCGKGRLEKSKAQSAVHTPHIGLDASMLKNGVDILRPEFLPQVPAGRHDRGVFEVLKIQSRMTHAHDK